MKELELEARMSYFDNTFQLEDLVQKEKVI